MKSWNVSPRCFEKKELSFLTTSPNLLAQPPTQRRAGDHVTAIAGRRQQTHANAVFFKFSKYQRLHSDAETSDTPLECVLFHPQLMVTDT